MDSLEKHYRKELRHFIKVDKYSKNDTLIKCPQCSRMVPADLYCPYDECSLGDGAK